MRQYLKSIVNKMLQTKNRQERRLMVEHLEERTLFAADVLPAIPMPHGIFAADAVVTEEMTDTPSAPVAPVADPSAASSPAPPFRDAERWAGTATDGGGLGQGDATTITWSIVRDGTSIAGFGGEATSDSDLVAFLGSIYGVTSNNNDFTDEPWFDELESIFDRWSELGGVTYVYEPNDSGAFNPGTNGATGVRGDVRIGGHLIDGNSGTLAYNFFPTSGGDMVIDTGDVNFYNDVANNSRGLRNVLAHEAGHGLGFDHINSAGSNFLMEPFIDVTFDGPQFDEVLIVQRQYGDVNEKGAGNDTRQNATDLGDLGDGDTITIGSDANDAPVAFGDTDFLSIDSDDDSDFFSFTVEANTIVDISLTPLGPTYNLEGSAFDASAQNDLTLTLFDSSGSAVVPTVDAGGLGDSEGLTDILLSDAGDYFVRVRGLHDNIQMYELELTGEGGGATAGPVDFTITAVDGDQIETESNVDFVFEVNRTGDLNQTSTVNFAVAGVGASPLSGAEIATPLTGTLTFTAGETAKFVTVTVIGDSLIENDESFRVTLSGQPEGSTISTATADGVVRDDDASVSVARRTAATINEGDSTNTVHTFRITRSGGTARADTVTFFVAGVGNNPATANDFTAGFPFGVITFDPGATIVDVDVIVLGDLDVEANEAFSFNLTGASNNTSIVTGSATATIGNDDTTYSITRANAVQVEGNSGTRNFTFNVTRTGITNVTGTVEFDVRLGTGPNAASAADFTGATSGVVSFTANATQRTVTIRVVGETLLENDETFEVLLSNPNRTSTITEESATGVIINDDALYSIAPTSATKVEGDADVTAFTFTATRTGDISNAGSVQYRTIFPTGVADPATIATDFEAGTTTGTVNFAADEDTALITINVTGDTTEEADETFTVELFSPSAGGRVGTDRADAVILNDDATFNIAPVTVDVVEGDAGASTHIFRITRSGDLSRVDTVDFTVTGTGLDPADAADFSSGFPSGTVNFAVDQTTADVEISVSGDNVFEADDEFTVTLSNASNNTEIGTASATSTIVNDDRSFSIAATAADLAEGNAGTTTFTFTVTRVGATTAAASIDFETIFGTGSGAANAADFQGATSGTLNFGIGETSQTIDLLVIGDTDFEPDEAFTVMLSNASDGSDIAIDSATGNIQNDDTSISIAPENAVLFEGDSGGTDFTFTVTRTGGGTAAVSNAAQYRTVFGSTDTDANAADILSGATGSVDFAAGETTATITVTVAGDLTEERNESFTVELHTPAAGTSLGQATAIGTILADDPPGTVSIAATPTSQVEGNSGVTAFEFTVTRTGNLADPATVDFDTVFPGGTGSATAADVTGTTSGTVTFGATEAEATITINVVGDNVIESDEDFTVELSNFSAGTIAQGSATKTISNDDATFSIAPIDADKLEGNSGTTSFEFEVTRSGDLDGQSTVEFAVVNGSTNNADFQGGLPSGTLTFEAGESSKTIIVPVVGDLDVESDETFTVQLSSVLGGQLDQSTALGTITDDDVDDSGIEVVDGVLIVRGTSGGDTIAIDFSQKTDLFTATLNGDSLDVDRSQVDSIAVFGRAGNDNVSIHHSIREDVSVFGEEGNDTIRGGARAENRLDGGAGNDTLVGGNKSDLLIGGDGNDRLLGRNANDILRGGAGEDNLIAGSGSDTLDGGADNDRLNGGTGNDILTGGSGNDIIHTGTGFDQVMGGDGDDKIFSFSSNIILGNAGNDVVTTRNGLSIIIGGQGEDRLNSSVAAARDVLIGGSTALDATDLAAALDVWTSNAAFQDRVDELLADFFNSSNLVDDNEVDVLTYRTNNTDLAIPGAGDIEN